MTAHTHPPIPSQAPRRVALWLARSLWIAVTLLVAAIFVAMLPTHLTQVRFHWSVQEAMGAVTRWGPFATYVLLVAAVRLLVGAVYAAAGLIIFWRRSNDPFAVFVSATLIMLALPFGLNGDLSAWELPPPLMAWVPWLPMLLAAATLACFALLLFLFPDGRFVPRQIRWLALVLVALIATVVAVFLSPTAARFLATLWQAGGFDPDEASWLLLSWTLLAGFLSGLAAQIYRYRRETDLLRRQQTKWVAWGLSAPLLSLLFILLLDWIIPEQSLFHAVENLLSPLLMTLIPLSILFSILRHRLWEIDLWINRTVAYGALSLTVVVVYALSVGIFSQVFTGGAGSVALLSAVLVVGLAPYLHRSARLLGDRLAPAGAAAPQLSSTTPSPTTLHGAARDWARALWLLLIGLTLIFLAANIPYLLARLEQPCRASECYGGRLQLYQVMLMADAGLSLALYAQLMTAMTLLMAVVGFGLAGLIFWRRSDDWMALLVGLVAAVSSIGGFEAGETVIPAWSGVFAALQVIVWISLVVVLFTFPDGRFRPRWAMGLVLIFGAFFLALPLLLVVAEAIPHPIWWAIAEWYWPAAIVIFFVTMAGGLIVQVQRYRRTTDAARKQQTKWAVFGLAVAALIWAGNAAALNFILPLLGLPWPSGGLYQLGSAALSAFSAIAIALGFGVAMLGYRLWGVDVALRRALVYGSFTVLIALSYIVLVGVLSTVFQGGGLWLSVVATGMIALLFQPLRQALQRGVNRLLYGERDDPATVLARLGQRLEGVMAADAVLPTLVETVAQALKLPYVAVALRQEGEPAELLVAHGKPPAQVESFPLLYQGEPLGRLDAAPRAAGEQLTAGDRRLLADIAHQAGPAIHALLLTADLQRSRTRLVTAREEERRRLRRDLHDGLGPQLASLAMQIDAARNLLPSDLGQADRLLQDGKRQMQEALAGIRRLVYDLRPPALDQLGLVSALRDYAAGHAAGSLQVVIDALEPLPPLPAAVEVAAYRIALEALTNVVRHAQAQHCWLHLRVDGGLQLEVEDDGRGLAPDVRHGVGITAMVERAAELGGTCTVGGGSNGGTLVRAWLPVVAGQTGEADG